ncbi:hypothetical protein J3E69DRAFT_373113 [Trichoderma sp. SZMC 28015]
MVKFNHFSPNCTLPDETPVGFIQAPNIRTTMQIAWGCFSVILFCTWSIFHLNMGVMLIAPEKLAEKAQVEWTVSHTILADIGGIVIKFPNTESADGDEKSFPNTSSSGSLLPSELKKSPENDEEYEFIRAFWRRQNRWLGGCEIPWKLLPSHTKHAKEAKKLLPEGPLRWKTENIAALSGNVWTLDSEQLAIATLVYAGLPFAPVELTTVAFSATPIILYSIEWEKPKDVNSPVYILATNHYVKYADFDAIVKASPFPYMQLPFLQTKHYYMPSVAAHSTDGNMKHIDAEAFIVALVTVVSFGGIHLFAWNLKFPTPVEGLLWKISAIITIACPALYSPNDVTKETAIKIKAVVALTSFFYVFARLFLITEIIRSLYYLPREAFIATSWTADLPQMK